MGHNSGDLADGLNKTAQGKLRSLIEVYAEAKGEGFDVKIVRKVVRLRKQDAGKRAEEEALTDLYISALGGL